VYNLGIGKTVSLKQVAAIIRELVPSSRISVRERGRTGHPLESDRRGSWPHDITRARRELGFSPEYDMPKVVQEIMANCRG